MKLTTFTNVSVDGVTQGHRRIDAAVLWLCSDAARYVTGVVLPVDAGNVIKKG